MNLAATYEQKRLQENEHRTVQKLASKMFSYDEKQRLMQKLRGRGVRKKESGSIPEYMTQLFLSHNEEIGVYEQPLN